MRAAIATIKRMSLRKKKEFRHLIRKTGTEVPLHFDKKKHTLVYLPHENKIIEMNMKELSEPLSTVFVTYDDLVSWIRSGNMPQNYKKSIMGMIRYKRPATKEVAVLKPRNNSRDVRQNVISLNNETIENHAINKPLLRNQLKRKKLQELKELALNKNVDLAYDGRLTKRVIIAKIIDKLRDAEKDFT